MGKRGGRGGGGMGRRSGGAFTAAEHAPSRGGTRTVMFPFNLHRPAHCSTSRVYAGLCIIFVIHPNWNLFSMRQISKNAYVGFRRGILASRVPQVSFKEDDITFVYCNSIATESAWPTKQPLRTRNVTQDLVTITSPLFGAKRLNF